MSTENEITTAHAMHLGSLKTSEALADKAVQEWCTGDLLGAVATMKSIIAWSRQMQTVLPAPTPTP